ncbi:hypothetical protein B0H14DRAFT_2613378 [Mycena olivaceomarginata]|nr:hypothetical protein B0H14DRAFT_2613378 [Mycena olivaceomarginata]
MTKAQALRLGKVRRSQVYECISDSPITPGPRLPTLRIASAAILIGTSHLPLPSNAPRRPTLERKHPKQDLEAGCFASLNCVRAPVFIFWRCMLSTEAHSGGRRIIDQRRPSFRCGRNLPLAGANFLLNPAPPPTATISRYTTAPSLAQADEILDTHIDILPFSPDPRSPLDVPADYSVRGRHPHRHNLSRFPNDPRGTAANPRAISPPPSTPLLAPTPHPRRHLQTVLQRQNTLRALILSHLLPSTRRLMGLSDDTQVTPYLYLHALALGGLSECATSTLGARVDTHSHFRRGAGRPRSARTCSTTPRRRRPRPPGSRAGTARSVQQVEDHAKANFWAAVLSLESVHRLGAIAFWVTGCRSCTSRGRRLRGSGGRLSGWAGGGGGDGGGGDGAEETVQKKVWELRDKDVVKRERGAECVKGIADLAPDNSGGLEEAWAELEGFVVARLNA